MKSSHRLLLLLPVIVALPCCTSTMQTAAYSAGGAALSAYATGQDPKLAAASAALGTLTSAKTVQNVQ